MIAVKAAGSLASPRNFASASSTSSAEPCRITVQSDANWLVSRST